MADRGRGRWLAAAIALAIALLLLLLLVADDGASPSTSGVEGAAPPTGQGAVLEVAAPVGAGATGAGQRVDDAPSLAQPATAELLVVVTHRGAPCAAPLTLRRGPEVVALAPDASGGCRVRLTPGWWSVAAPAPFEEVSAWWTADDPRRPTAPTGGGTLTFAGSRAAVVLVPWGAEPGEAPDLPDAVRHEARESPEQLLHLDLRGPRLLAGVVRAGPGEQDPPFAGATVDLELGDREEVPGPAPAQRAWTGPDGRFRFVVSRALLSEAGFDARIVARAPGRVPATWDVSWSEDDEEDGVLVLAPGALTLAGRVVDAAGAPVPGAVVTAAPAFGTIHAATALTGADGRFRLEGLAPGSRGPGHAVVTVSASLGPARATRPDVLVGPGTDEVELVLARASELVVSVEAGGTGAIEGWLHVADGRAPRQLPACWPRLRVDCADGEWLELLVTSPGYVPRRVALRAPCAPAVVGLERPARTLSGRVTNPDGTPAGNVIVHGRWGDWSEAAERALALPPSRPGLEERDVLRLHVQTTSGPDGSFTLDGLPGPGSVQLHAGLLVADGLPSRSVAEERHVASSPPSAEAGGPPVELTLGAPWACRVRLRLVAAETGEPLQGARVQRSAVRRVGGAFEVDLHRPGRHTFGVSADGRVSRDLEVDVRADQPLDLGDVRLDPAGALEVVIGWPAAPIARVELGRAGEEPAQSLDPELGGHDEPLVVDGLVPGTATWVVTLHRPDGRRQQATFAATVVAGETTRVEVDLREAPLLPPAEER